MSELEGTDLRTWRRRRVRSSHRASWWIEFRWATLLAGFGALVGAGAIGFGMGRKSAQSLAPPTEARSHAVGHTDRDKVPVTLRPKSGVDPRREIHDGIATGSSIGESLTASTATTSNTKRRVRIADGWPTSGFGLQIGAFLSMAEAEAFLEGHPSGTSAWPVYVGATEIPGRGTWFRVRLGHAKRREDAERWRADLDANLKAVALVVSYP